MQDAVILFLLAFGCVWLFLLALPRALLPPAPGGLGGPQGLWLFAFVIAFCTACAIAVLDYSQFGRPIIHGPWWYEYWFNLGHGAAVIGGVIAGVMARYAFMLAITEMYNRNWKVYLAVSAGPAFSILALALISIPGTKERLGLTGLKAGPVEVTLSTAAPPAPGSGSGVIIAGASGTADPRFDTYYDILKKMTEEKSKAGELKPAAFRQRPYFYREGQYLRRLDGLVLPEVFDKYDYPSMERKPAAIAEQIDFVQSFRGIITCGASYHRRFPDVATLRRAVSPLLQTLVAIESDMEDLSLSKANMHRTESGKIDPGRTSGTGLQEIRDDLERRLDILMKRSADLMVGLADALPKSMSDCKSDALPSKWRFRSANDPLPDETLVPPYLAIVIANAYAAFHAKDNGLEVLNSWISYYDAVRAKQQLPMYLYSRALNEYGTVQTADEAFPTTSRERFYLDVTRKTFEADWAGQFAEGGLVTARALTPSDSEVEASLYAVYSDVLQQFLHTVVETHSAAAGDPINSDQVRWARSLIASAAKQVKGEDPTSAKFRQTMARIEGGRLLARWSVDGVTTGYISPSEGEKVRQEALRALVDALPAARELEKAELVQEGPVRLHTGYWEPYRRLVDQEILDIEARLSH